MNLSHRPCIFPCSAGRKMLQEPWQGWPWDRQCPQDRQGAVIPVGWRVTREAGILIRHEYNYIYYIYLIYRYGSVFTSANACISYPEVLQTQQTKRICQIFKGSSLFQKTTFSRMALSVSVHDGRLFCMYEEYMMAFSSS